MATFCGNCGFPQAANASFCPNCGARQQAGGGPPSSPISAPQQPVMRAAPAAAPQGGGGLKIVLIAVVCLAIAGFLAIAGLWYVGHRVKQAVIAKAKEYGVDMPVSTDRHTSNVPHKLDACALLPKDEAARLLGQPVARTLSDMPSTCGYYGPPGLAEKLAQERWNSAAKHATSGGQVTEGEITGAVQHMAKVMGMGDRNAYQNGSNGELPLLIFVIADDGRQEMTALEATNAIFGPIFKAAGDAQHGSPMMGPVPGLGDKAIRAPQVGLNVLKGDTLIRLVAGPIPNPEEVTVAIARDLLPKI